MSEDNDFNRNFCNFQLNIFFHYWFQINKNNKILEQLKYCFCLMMILNINEKVIKFLSNLKSNIFFAYALNLKNKILMQFKLKIVFIYS